MNIKLELLSEAITETVRSRLDRLDIDVDKIAEATAISVLSEIQQVI